MSWQKIFRLARRLGSPIVLTDQEGKDPLVILPFAQFEKLTEHDTETPSDSLARPFLERQAEPDDRTLSVFELPYEDFEQPKSKDLAKKKGGEPAGPVERLEDLPTPQGSETAEISLDERFYFEPLDDEPKK